MDKTEKKTTRNKKMSRILLGILGLAGVVTGILKYREAQHFETTDDAQLETDISPVSARVPGYIAAVRFSDNQPVRKGDTLVVLDDRDLRIRVEQAEAALENATASLEVTHANAGATQDGGGTAVYRVDELNIRFKKAEKDYDRYKQLYQQGATTEQQLEKSQAEKETLEQQLHVAQQQQKESNSKTVTANEQIKVAESMVKQRQSDLDFARLQESFAYILAPFDGIVSKKNAVVGQLLQAGQPLCSIMDTHNIWAVANFKETQFDRMKPGMQAEVQVDAYPGKKLNGVISSFASATGSVFSLIPPDNATGNYVKVVQRVPVKIELDKSSEIFQYLKPGMSVDVKVRLAE